MSQPKAKLNKATSKSRIKYSNTDRPKTLAALMFRKRFERQYRIASPDVIFAVQVVSDVD